MSYVTFKILITQKTYIYMTIDFLLMYILKCIIQDSLRDWFWPLVFKMNEILNVVGCFRNYMSIKKIYVKVLKSLSILQILMTNLKKLFLQFHKLCKSSVWGNTRSLLNKSNNFNFNHISISCQRIVSVI